MCQGNIIFIDIIHCVKLCDETWLQGKGLFFKGPNPRTNKLKVHAQKN
jgi:hypothetical protein